MADGKDGACADVAAAVAEARAAQPNWAGLAFRERGRLLRRLAARARADEALAGIISSETGKPPFEAIGFEIAYLCEITRFLSGATGRRMLGESRRGSLIFPHKRARVNWQPHGVVAVIGPWNFPLLNNFGDAVAPLLAGNSVVLKPSPYTPQTSRRMRTLWRESGLPEGVFQVVEGGAETGSALVDACDMVFFTGGLAAGRQVAGRAGRVQGGLGRLRGQNEFRAAGQLVDPLLELRPEGRFPLFKLLAAGVEGLDADPARLPHLAQRRHDRRFTTGDFHRLPRNPESGRAGRESESAKGSRIY